jgi:radical SAM protein with 4Fe4S-binding SPASM domain
VAFLQLTNACNARCIHCCVDSAKKLPNELAESQWHAVLDDLASLGVTVVSFTGGEPATRPDLLRLVEHAARDLGMYVCLESNGSLLTDDVTDALVEAGLARFSISLDGTTSRTNDAFRMVNGMFDKVVARLRYLVAQSLPHAVWCTVSRANLDEALAMPRFLAKLGVSDVMFVNMSSIGRGHHEEHLLLSNEEWVRFYRAIEALRPRYAGRLRMRFNPFMIDPDDRAIFEDAPFDCAARQRQSVHIRADGQVFPCVLLLNEDHFGLGSLHEASFRTIWRSSVGWGEWESEHRTEACEPCVLRPKCSGGCPAYAWAHRQTAGGRDPRCDGTYVPVCPCISAWTGEGKTIGLLR